ncbi:hypothetical protein PR048_029868 [Dryococelus australis]|uniref:Uncharacterized protein n=1 Tax=Dryococelus australis TaxID=614101 RepID=A0ABQ9G887_9NEOP|nr:hypothetical protein PR048_029868 [Dryococelus australis]
MSTATAWVQKLTKVSLIQLLKESGEEMLDAAGIEELRVKTRALVRKFVPCELYSRIPHLTSTSPLAVVNFFVYWFSVIELNFCHRQMIYVVATFRALEESWEFGQVVKICLNAVSSEIAVTNFRLKLLESKQMVNQSMYEFVKDMLGMVQVVEYPCSKEHFTQLVFNNLLPKYSIYFCFAAKIITCLLSTITGSHSLQSLLKVG